MTRSIELKINGETFHVEVEPHETLLDVIRGRVGLTGTKKGCDTGQCGACTIIVEGKAVNSCLILAVEAHGREIVTVEGLAKDGAAPSPPTGLRRRGGRSVRLLHAGNASLGKSPPG
jgi:carbon-monoxide dehydrogenase small subunit